MTRWIAFDQDTVADLRSQLPHDSVFEAPGRSVIEYALTATRPVVALFRRAGGDEVTIAVFRATWSDTVLLPKVTEPALPAEVEEQMEVQEQMPVRASGFLGLSDSLIGADEEENSENRRWWQFWK